MATHINTNTREREQYSRLPLHSGVQWFTTAGVVFVGVGVCVGVTGDHTHTDKRDTVRYLGSYQLPTPSKAFFL